MKRLTPRLIAEHINFTITSFHFVSASTIRNTTEIENIDQRIGIQKKNRC